MRKSEKGQSLVEMALIFPVLLLLFAGIVDLGRGFNAYITITNAAREGARYGSFYPTDTTGIQTHVQNEAAGTGITITNISVTFPSGNAPGNPIRVEVTYSFSTILGLVLGQSSIQLTNAAEMIIYGE
ncbi:MAG: TadE/TadG family type IV pilus assembly protein [Anaerolineae bacterium]